MNYVRKRVAVARRKKALTNMDVELSSEAKNFRRQMPPAVALRPEEDPKSEEAPLKDGVDTPTVTAIDPVDNDVVKPASPEDDDDPKPEASPEPAPDKEEEKPKPRIRAVVDSLAVSVYHLERVFIKEKVMRFRDVYLTGSSTVYEIENPNGPTAGAIRQATAGYPCPFDGEKGCAYVYTVEAWGADHVGKATHMLSYSWRYTIQDIADTLNAYCTAHDLDPKRTYVWIDCLCVNLHRTNQQQDKDAAQFQSDLDQTIQAAGHVLAMMDPIEAPVYLTRTWCLWEMYTAKAHSLPVDILLPPEEKEALKQDVIQELGGVGGLYSSLGSTNIQNTQSSVEHDKTTILKIVEEGEGYDALNKQVIEVLRGWMKGLLKELADERENTNDTNYANFCTSIGTVFWDNQEYDEALIQYQKCCDIQQKLYGEEDPDTAITYNNIGLVQKDKGDYEAALVQFRKCLAIDQASLGDTHPGVADSYANIGCVLLDKGDYDESLEEYRKGLAIQEASLGKDHFDTATTYKSIGTVLEAKGDNEAALAEYKKCFAIQFAEFGDDHPSTTSTMEAIKSVKEAIAAEGKEGTSD